MEHENEALDWGNEDEEQKEAYRRASHDYATLQDSALDAEGGAEDTISLGDEEEEDYYFQREVPRRCEDSVDSANMEEELFDRPQSPRRRADSMGANEQPRYQHDSRDRDYYERDSPRTSNMPLDSPPRERDQDQASRHQASPSQITTTRLKHALPPKPVTAKVPYLPPSHPSIVAATSMTDTPVNGTTSVKPASSSVSNDLPHPWVLRRARAGGEAYYYNTATDETSWYHPVSNIPSSSSGQPRHRTRSGSSTDKFMTPSNSNIPQSQTSRSRSDREISRGRPEHDEEITAADRQRMTFTDRHYRPGAQPATTPAPAVREIHPTGRADAPGDHHPSRSRYERSPPPSSPRQRRRARSISPPVTRGPPPHSRNAEYPPRGSHLDHRERHGYTNTIPPISQRETDISRDRWAPSHLPPSEYDRSDRISHKPPPRPVNAENRDYGHLPHEEPRPYVRRRESSRGPPRDRDREQPRYPDGHEYTTANSGFQSASRPYVRDREPARDYPPQRELSGLAYSERKERAPPFDRSTSSNGPPSIIAPPDREPYNPRLREYDERPPATYDHRRNSDRDFDRPRRDVPPPDVFPLRRHPSDYPAPREIVPPPTTIKANRYSEPYDRPSPEDPAQLSHRRRQPLPPQTTTFMSAPPGRDPPPQAPPPQPEPPKVKTAGWANFDPTLPRQPKFETRGAQRNVQAAQGGNVFEQAKRESEERSRYFREKALADMEKSRLAMEAMAASVPKPLNTGTPKPKPSVVSTPVFDPDRRNNVTTPQERDRQEFVQRPPKLDTRMDIDPRDVADMRRPASPRGMRSMRPRQDDEERYPGGPRSAISTHTPTPRAVFPASIVPPPNARYENGYSAGLPPPRDINPGDDRRFNEHRPEWRDNRTGDVYPERGPMPTRRDFRSRSAENDQAPPAASGTNNVPIGTRRSNGPVPTGPAPFLNSNGAIPGPPPRAFGFNPDARPPPSTLIRPQSMSDLKRGQEYNRSTNTPATDEPRRNGLPPPATPQNSAPQLVVNQQAVLSAEGDKAKRRVSRFSPLVSKPELSQEQTPLQQVAGRTPEETQTRPLPQADPGVSADRRTPQNDTRPRDAGRREDRPALSRFADNVGDPTSSHVQASEPGQPASSEPASAQRPRYRWSEQMANAAAPDSPEAAVEQKPPRHRKYTAAAARFTGSGDNSMAVDAPSSDLQNGQDGTLSFMERLENPGKSRRNSTTIPLLERLSSVQDSARVSPDSSDAPTPSLRDRLVPSKRDRDDMAVDAGEPGGQVYDGEDGNDTKRMKRRATKAKRGGRR